MKVIAIVMQKGGTGKTTTAAHLAVALADRGRRVLLVDMDPQAQQAQIFGVTYDETKTVAQVLLKECSLEDATHRVGERLAFVPCQKDWSQADVALFPPADGRHRLKTALALVRDAYDYVVIDTPPNLGAMTANALVAATHVLIPVKTDQADVNEIPTVLRHVGEARDYLNPDLQIIGLLPTAYDCRNSQDRELLTMLTDNPAGVKCFDAIPRRTRIKEVFTGSGIDFGLYDSETRASFELVVEAL